MIEVRREAAEGETACMHLRIFQFTPIQRGCHGRAGKCAHRVRRNPCLRIGIAPDIQKEAPLP
ncbi:MAG: hypothetical protein JWL77_1052 [Chthonomonadaceae bacterium]|nr:hypothetical protein [Chthonomonadaceae bacterium]